MTRNGVYDMSDVDKVKNEIREISDSIKNDKGLWRSFRRWRDKLKRKILFAKLGELIMDIFD